MRVLACVTSNAQGVTPLRLNGPWVEATSLPANKRPGRARAGSLDVNLDPVGEVRGECQASKCSAYLAPEERCANAQGRGTVLPTFLWPYLIVADCSLESQAFS
eukprot:s236_g17.t1